MQLQPRGQQPTPINATPPPNQSQQARPLHSTQTPPRKTTKKTSRFNKKAALLVGILLLACIGAYIAWQTFSSQVMPNRYQAVFLDNGQVYFGKLHGYYGAHPYMTDVYYFQANSQTGNSEQSSGTQLLVKLGKEIHAPEDKLLLNKDAIQFVENLQDGGSVVDAIKKNTQQPQATVQPTGGITR